MSAPTLPDPSHTEEIRPLRYDQPVARAAVHKTGPGEVFLTDYVQTAGDTFLVAAELPRSHAFYGDTASATPGIDPITLLEIGRQCGYIVLHDHFGIPLENTFVMRSMGASLAPGAASLAIDGPVPLHATLWLKTPYHRDGRLVGFLGIATMTLTDGTPVGEVHASFSWITHDDFRAFRAATRQGLGLPTTLPAPAWADEAKPTEAYGRRSARNAMLGDVRHRGDLTTAWLRPDLGYVGVFDHAYDHVPGMAQTEGSKQLAIAGAAHRLGLAAEELVPRSLEATFHAINEVDWETELEATFSADDATGGLRAAIVARQDGRSLGEVEVLVTPRG